jgi:hypothetical protein
MPNPLTEIKTALRGYLVAHWASLDPTNPAFVRVQNRGGVADNPAVDTRRVEIRTITPFKTSSSGTFLAVYELGYRSDETKLDVDTESLDATEWELIRVAAKAAVEKLGLSYVLRVAVEAARQTVAATEMTKEGQWSGAATLIIEFQQTRAQIIPS